MGNVPSSGLHQARFPEFHKAWTVGVDRVRSACSKFAHYSRLPEASLQWAFPDRRSEIPKHPLGRRTPLFCFFGLVQRRMGGGKCS